MRAAEHAPRDPFPVLERRYGLVEIVERGTGVHVERIRVTTTHRDRQIMTIPEDASRYGYQFAQQCLDFFAR